MRIIKSILTIFTLSIAIVTSAQIDGQEEAIKRCAVEAISQLNDYILFMANKNKSVEHRMQYKTKALNMFVGNGYSYEENGVNKEGALIHIKTRNGRIHTIPVRNYFESLVTDKRSYSGIKIETAEKHVVEEEAEDGMEYYVLFGDLYAIENRQ